MTAPSRAHAALTVVIGHASARRRHVGEIVEVLRRELARLNHAGVSPALMRNRTRRERARLVKAALLERYQTYQRCC
jgi:hypothetical protein